MSTMIDLARQYWPLCQDVALHVYANEPSAEYADRVARLLLGTAAQESEFRAQRQHGFAPAPFSTAGAFGIWQCERATLEAMLKWLGARPEVMARAATWLGGSHVPLVPENAPRLLFDLQLADGDRIDALFARIRYLMVRDPVPGRPAEQAWYWLRWYNGRGATKKYIRAGMSEEQAAALAVGEYLEKWYTGCFPAINRVG